MSQKKRKRREWVIITERVGTEGAATRARVGRRVGTAQHRGMRADVGTGA